MSFRSRAALILPRGGWRARQNLWRLGVLLAVAAVVTAAFLLHTHLSLRDAGYLVVGLSALVASAALAVPVPALATACAASVFLNPLVIAGIAGTAEAAGELTGYFLGYSGEGVVSRLNSYRRLQGWMRQRGWLPLFILALVPNPVFDVAGIAAGALGYPLPRFLGVVWVGKLLKFLGIGYACLYGYQGAVRIFFP